MTKIYAIGGGNYRTGRINFIGRVSLLLFVLLAAQQYVQAQTNLALSASVMHSSGGATPYAAVNYNDNVIPTNTTTFGWVNNGAYIEYTWGSNQYIDEVRFYLGNRNMTSCTIQYWNGSAYVNCNTYTGSAGTGLITVTRTFTGVTTTRLRFSNLQGSNPNFREIQVYGCQTGCINAAAESTPTLSAASACSNGTFRIGSGAYYDLSIAANTYYNFSWSNNSAANINGFCATPQNGSGSTGSFSSNTTNWFSGSTTTLRVSANRANCSWVATSGIMTYRHSQPTVGTVTGTGANTTVCDGDVVNYTQNSIGTGAFEMFQYQWTVTTGTWNNWGTTNPYSWTSNDGSGTVLNVRGVANNNGCRTYSTSVATTVSPATVGGSVSSNGTICTGSQPSANLTLSGHTGSVVRWEKATNTSFTSPTTIAVTSTTLTPAQAGTLTATTYFRAVVKSGVCGEVASAYATITVSPATVGGSVSSNGTICTGSQPSANLTLSGHTGSVVRWEKATNTSFTSPTTIAVTSTTLTPAQAGTLTATTYFRAVVKSGVCGEVASAYATITVSPATVGGSVSSNGTICTGSQPSANLTLSGHTGSVVRWESATNTSFTSPTTIAVTSTTLTPAQAGTLTTTTYFRAVVKSGACTEVASAYATITVSPATVGGTVAGSGTICTGSQPSANLTLSGHTGSVVRWESATNTSFTSPTTIAVTSTTLTPAQAGTLTATTYFRAVVKSGACAEVASGYATITVSPATVGGTVAGSGTICTGNQPSANLTLSGHTGSVVRWESATNTSFTSPTTIAVTSTTLTSAQAGTLTTTTYFRAVVKSGACTEVASAYATITVSPATVGGSVSSNGTICTGNQPSANLTLSGHTGSVVRWESATNTSFTSPTTIAVTSTTLTPAQAGTLTATTYFRAVVKSGACTEVASAYATITVSPATVGGSVSSNGTICTGSQPSANLTLSGHTGSVVRWEKATNTSFTSPTTIAVTSTTLTPAQAGTLTTTTYFRAVVKSGACTEVGSAYATITVSPATVGGTVGSNGAICTGNQPSANLTLSGHTGSVVRWESATNTSFTSPTTIANTTTTLTPAQAGTLTTTTYFRAVVKSGACAEVASAYATITVSTAPVANASTDITICTGTAAIAMTGATATGAYTGTPTWSGGTGLGTWSQDANPALAVFTPSTPNGTIVATLTLTGGGGCGNATDTRTISWNSAISGLTASFSTNPVCEGNDVTLNASVAAGVVATWLWTGPDSYVDNSQNSTVPGVVELYNEGVYTIIATNMCDEDTAYTPTLDIHRAIVGLDAAAPAAVCEGSDLALTASYSGVPRPVGEVTWNWSGPNAYTASVQNPTRIGLAINDGGVYTVSASNACGTVTASDTVQVDDFIDADADVNLLAAPGPDNSVIEACGTLVVNLQGNNPSPGTGTWSMAPNTLPNTGSIVSMSPNAQSSNVNITYSHVDPLPVSFRWTINNGVCPPSESEVRVIFDPAITVTTQLAGCSFTSADSIMVQVSGSGGTGTLNYGAPAGGELRVDINSNNKAFTVPMNGTSHTFSVSDAFCTATQNVSVPNGHSLDIAYSASNGTMSSSCYQVDFNKWTTYSDNSNKAILAVNDNGQDLGLVNVTVYKDAAVHSIPQSLGGDNCQGYNSTAMQRHFVLTSANTFANPVGLRIFFTNDELQALITASQSNDVPGDLCSENDNIYDINGLYLTKYTGANEDGDYTNNSPSGLYKVYGDATSLPTQPNGPLSKGQAAFGSIYSGAQNHHYVELTVSEFSELWLHGSQNGTALPVEMLFFEAEVVSNAYVNLKWATSLEINNNGFQVERSTDGLNWGAIGWVDGHGNATVQHNYAFDDNNVVPGIHYYYRLKQVDNDGAYEYTGVVSAIVSMQITFSVKDFVPNPAVAATNLIISSNNDQEVEVGIYNIIGEQVIIGKHQLNKGSNMVTFELDNIPAGTYTAVVSSANEVYSKKLVVTK